MDWIKRIIREMWPFWLLGAASGAFIAMSVVDTVRLKECNAQIVDLRQELAQLQKELRACQEKPRTPLP
jgi:hypothetical protein